MNRKAIRALLLLILAFALLSGCGSAQQTGETAEAPAETAAPEMTAAPVPAEEASEAEEAAAGADEINNWAAEMLAAIG